MSNPNFKDDKFHFGAETKPQPLKEKQDPKKAKAVVPVRMLDLSKSFPAFGKDKVYSASIAKIGYSLHLFAANEQKSSELGPIKRCVLHWTAGSGLQIWDDYHFNIALAGNNPVAIKTCGLKQKGQHLYKRNTGSVGFTFSAPGPKGVTPQMLEMMAKLLAEFCYVYKLDPDGKTADGFWVIDDHAAYAKVDGYYPDRWDIGELMKPLRQKAAWYYQHCSDSNLEFKSIL
jgi:hypothetical protein